MLRSSEIRKAFFDFFTEKGHKIVPSASLVLKDDPTLLFTNAGMNPFKNIFLGIDEPQVGRVANAQKCLRVRGKHNDLEEVGIDTYHHTFFEMLGNWSFGDYFKEDAIRWGWEFLTEILKLDKDRLYVTVFEGDQEDGVDRDNEAATIWSQCIDKKRILDFGKKDNFWEMGKVGPCGPSSEIHYDLRSEEERQKTAGRDLVNQDHPQVIEIWNLVFIQYQRKKDQNLEPLPKKHVDTGMGLERLVRVIQNKTSNYDTDLFTPILDHIAYLTDFDYGKDEKIDVAFRVIADHIRALCFCMADGVLPSNTGPGYVIRRVLRRAIRYGYSFLNQRDAFIYLLVDVVHKKMSEQYPELTTSLEITKKIIKQEEIQFLRTLQKGLDRFNVEAEKMGKIDGKVAFELYDTYGFPIDLTELLARERSLELDIEGFNSELEKQKQRSKKASEVDASDWKVVREDGQTEFLGYDTDELQAHITQYRKVEDKKGAFYHVVLNQTCFYPEGGGQVGDRGFFQQGDKKVSVVDTKKENNQIIHVLKDLPSDLNENVFIKVDLEKRRATEKNHSATHLLHKALRDVLGTHVQQKGSLVNEKHLRFDFSHFEKVSQEDLEKIEKQVNAKIKNHIHLNEFRNMAMDEAKSMGAMALFGEKYGDHVRVIQFDDSIELCGGTHVKDTGDIVLFKITSEGSVAAGVRRIEAITGSGAIEFYKKQDDILQKIQSHFPSSKNLEQTILQLKDKAEQLEKQLEKLDREKATNYAASLLQQAEDVDGVKFIGAEIDLSADGMKNLAFQLKQKEKNLFLALASKQNNKALLTIAISDDLVKDRNLHAGNLIREIAKEIQGGGGGQSFYATAGGKNVGGIASALKKAREVLG